MALKVFIKALFNVFIDLNFCHDIKEVPLQNSACLGNKLQNEKQALIITRNNMLAHFQLLYLKVNIS